MADIANQYPTSPGFETVNFEVNTPTLTSETFSGKLKRVGMGHSYYTWEVKYPNLIPLDAGTVQGFAAQTFGGQFSFEIVLPKISYSKLGTLQGTNTIIAQGQNTAGGSTRINFAGAAANAYIFAAGDFVKFANHSKVYQVVAPCQANGSGTGTIFFSGALVETVPAFTQIRITAIPFTAVLAANVQSWDVGRGGITSMSLAMREVW